MDHWIFIGGLVLGIGCAVWGVIDWFIHRHSTEIDAGGEVLKVRLIVGAMIAGAAMYRLIGG